MSDLRWLQLFQRVLDEAASNGLDLGLATARMRRSGYLELARGQFAAGASDKMVLNLLRRGLKENA